eukprot:TRINITY_DN2431_c0_g1_i1.p1 TRINITY_DN2431_c0_g1~~TRINITY_DN2431_c0_g1_i1.p1  ORF type:complete len:655 (+),score=165.37 TRINITY_DN2431_c0_g1_i1:48-2012(+)
MEGYLLKQGADVTKRMRRRFFQLEGSVLKYYEDEKKTNILGQIPMKDLKLNVTNERTFGLDLVTSYRTYYLSASDVNDLSNWMTALNDAIEAQKGTTSALEEVTKKGFLYKIESEGVSQQFYFVLRGDNLYYYEGLDERQTAVDQVAITMCKVRAVAFEVPNASPNDFELITPHRTYTLRAYSTAEKEQWMQALTLQSKMRRQYARSSVMQMTPEPSKAPLTQSSPGWLTSSRPWSVRDPTTQAMQRLQTLLTFAASENHCCADCGDFKPRWASLTLGVFICIECSGIHRSMGAEFSKVRSVDLDRWDVAAVESMGSKGNASVNAVYEFNKVEANKFKPKANDLRSNKEKYIYLKYKLRAFVDPQTVPAENKEVTPVTENTAKEDTTTNTRGTVASNPDKLLEDIYMEGWLTKEGKKSGKWQMRWFVLKDHKISYYRSKLVSEPAGVIELSHAHVKVSSIDRVNTFEIIIPNRVYYIQTDNSSDFFAWQEVIKQAIHQYNVIYRNLNLESSGALELIRQIGPNKTLQAVYEEKRQSTFVIEYSGYLTKRGDTVKSWKKRWFVLKDNRLAYYAKKEDQQPKGSIPLGGTDVKVSTEETAQRVKGCPSPAMFEIATPGRVFYIEAESTEDMEKWLGVICLSIQRYRERKQPPSTVV